MLQIFANLPSGINKAISNLLSKQETTEWLTRAAILHSHYMNRDKGVSGSYINDFSDVLAYLGLRTPATYAQIYSVLSQVQEIMPVWQPKSLLDIGSGPGTGIWATKSIWPGLETATAIDREKYFLPTGKEIIQKASFPVKVLWQQQDITTRIDNRGMGYDVILIANVLNELDRSQRRQLLGQAYNLCKGVMVIIEPGTSAGTKIVQETAKDFSKFTLLAPYINNTFVESQEQWIHFSQRFIRPEFQRRIRQHMRTSSLTASDWEETKYAYVVIGKIPAKEKVWGRSIGLIKKQKGFLEVPILTQDGIKQVKVLKRHKKEYSFAKNLQWGQAIKDSRDIIS